MNYTYLLSLLVYGLIFFAVIYFAAKREINTKTKKRKRGP